MCAAHSVPQAAAGPGQADHSTARLHGHQQLGGHQWGCGEESRTPVTPRRALGVQVGQATGGQQCHRGREQGSRGGPARCSSPGHSNATHRPSPRRRLLPHGGARPMRPPAPCTQCPESELRDWHHPPGPPRGWSPPGRLPGTGSPGSRPGPTACGPRMPGAGGGFTGHTYQRGGEGGCGDNRVGGREGRCHGLNCVPPNSS